MFDPDKFYSVSQVAEIFNASPKTIWHWIKVGKLPPTRKPFRRLRGDELAKCLETGRPWREIEADQGEGVDHE